MEPIRIEGLSKLYRKGLRRQRVLAVNDLSLSVADGEIFGFIGPNGAGKSTTIKILCDLIRPTTGRATIMGVDVQKPEARRQIGYLPENPSYYAFLTGWELLTFNGTIHGMSDAAVRQRGRDLLGILDIADAAHRPLRTYSKGMVQRVGIAAALIHDPSVLIFDEPMSGLDPIGRMLIMDLLVDLRAQGKTVFFSTHILHDVEVICDRIGIISAGQLRFSGTLTEVISEGFSSYDVVITKVSPEQVGILQNKGFVPNIYEDKVQMELPKEELTGFLETCKQENIELFSIEPKRFSLEDYFMDFISQ